MPDKRYDNLEPVTLSPSLLITDDDRDFRETIRDVFEPRGFRTVLASNGAEAVEIVRTQEIHLVLLDMHMPKLTGIQALSRIKSFHSRIPCILISGQLDEEIRSQAESAFGVLAKPVNFQEITRTVSLAMKLTYDWPANFG